MLDLRQNLSRCVVTLSYGLYRNKLTIAPNLAMQAPR